MLLRKMRNYFVAGLLVLLPVGVTAWVLVKTFIQVDGFLGDLISRYTGHRIPGTGFVATIVIIFLVGLFASNLLGRKLISLGEYILNRIPFVNKIYVGVQQISAAILHKNKPLFREVVLIEYPRLDVYAVAFKTNEMASPLQDTDGEELVSVFVPTTPNPTSGFLLLLRQSDVISLPISVDEGVKLVISGGSVLPESWGPGLPQNRSEDPHG